MHLSEQTVIEAGERGEEAVIRVRGKGTFRVAQPLKTFGLEVVKKGIRHLSVDLEECPSVDSTFIGVLALISRLGRRGMMSVKILNAGEIPCKQIRSLGIGKMFDFEHHEVPSLPLNSITTHSPLKPRDIAHTALEAHEELVAGNPSNKPIFSGVINGLKADVADLDGAPKP